MDRSSIEPGVFVGVVHGVRTPVERDWKEPFSFTDSSGRVPHSGSKRLVQPPRSCPTVFQRFPKRFRRSRPTWKKPTCSTRTSKELFRLFRKQRVGRPHPEMISPKTSSHHITSYRIILSPHHFFFWDGRNTKNISTYTYTPSPYHGKDRQKTSSLLALDRSLAGEPRMKNVSAPDITVCGIDLNPARLRLLAKNLSENTWLGAEGGHRCRGRKCPRSR